MAIEVSHFLAEWLIHHIKGEDQKMIRFMREKIGLQYVEGLTCEPLPIELHDLIEKLRREHLSPAAIARITGISELCLQSYLDCQRLMESQV